jgi:carbamate kinase
MQLEGLISLMQKFTFSNDVEGEIDDVEGEIDEQDAAAASGGGGYPTVTKWETGLTRSVANTVDDKVTWKSLNKITRGKANTLL